jgi:hypothetical protein
MKKVILLLFITLFYTCNKNDDDCANSVIITNTAPSCDGWGIIVSGTKYPSMNIPDQFKEAGLVVCATYELYDDLRLCVCCGGKYADIKKMSRK